MKISPEQRQEILAKHTRLASIAPILKTEFKGIDSVIDQVIDSIRPFYIFPQSLKRPLIVNLWGMTGTGKTSLVLRIVELLELNHQFCRFDIGEYVSESSDWKLRKDLQSKSGQSKNKHLVVMFDEFQFGRTIDEHSKEVDRPSLRPLWDIIDSGVIQTWTSSTFEVIRLANRLEKALENGVNIIDGIVQSGEIEYDAIVGGDSHYIYAHDYSEHGTDKITSGSIYKSSAHTMSKPYFLKKEHFNILFTLKPEFFDDIPNYDRWYKEFRKGKDGRTILEFIDKNFIRGISMMKKEDYSQSLIVCLGNIDEAYAMTHSSDPDADADLFYEHSLKITIPKMKKALAQRFRMEQIGRLGNNHIIYPSFNRKTYEEIIVLGLEARIKTFRDDFGLKLQFDPQMNDIIYKEGVFPTQGARPVLSTFSTLIDSYIAQIISDIVLEFPDATRVQWNFIDGATPIFEVIAIDGKKKKKTFTYPVKLTLENLRKSDYSETQASVAVHEAGHAVTAIMKLKLVPKEVKSRTASVAEGVCYLKSPTITTRQSIYNDIVVSLGGLEAEKLVFGKDTMSAGGTSDLQRATANAAAMIKTYGMGEHMHTVTVPNPLSAHNIYDPGSNQEAEMAAIELVKQAQIDASKCLQENMDFLMELSAHLAEHPNINEEDLTTMAKKYTVVFLDQENYYGFREQLSKKSNTNLFLGAAVMLAREEK